MTGKPVPLSVNLLPLLLARAQGYSHARGAVPREAARDAVIEELRAELARLRLPFWRRWAG